MRPSWRIRRAYRKAKKDQSGVELVGVFRRAAAAKDLAALDFFMKDGCEADTLLFYICDVSPVSTAWMLERCEDLSSGDLREAWLACQRLDGYRNSRICADLVTAHAREAGWDVTQPRPSWPPCPRPPGKPVPGS